MIITHGSLQHVRGTTNKQTNPTCHRSNSSPHTVQSRSPFHDKYNRLPRDQDHMQSSRATTHKQGVSKFAVTHPHGKSSQIHHLVTSAFHMHRDTVRQCHPSIIGQAHAEGDSLTLRQACSLEKPASAMCVQNLDDSRGFAIRITYRISLRSSSLWEPRHPLLKVVYIKAYANDW